MVLKITQFIALLLAALIAGVTFCHVLELPNKLTLSAPIWLQVQQVLYQGFGPKAGAMEVGAAVSTLVLLFLVRKRRLTFSLTLVAAVCFVAALIVWFQVINPVNLLVNSWTIETLPANWAQARHQWEYGHATHAAIFIMGLVALILSVLADTVDSHTRNLRQRKAHDYIESRM